MKFEYAAHHLQHYLYAHLFSSLSLLDHLLLERLDVLNRQSAREVLTNVGSRLPTVGQLGNHRVLFMDQTVLFGHDNDLVGHKRLRCNRLEWLQLVLLTCQYDLHHIGLGFQ